tara:strand:+ start:810 stop:1403 length:594 start_codon:yes stop_codon:yes gene_type:complete
MAKKTLLNEATVRRFMGLAGMQANVVSSHLKENYAEMEEDYMEEGQYMEDDEDPSDDAEAPEVDDVAVDVEDEEDAADEMDAGEEPEASIDEDQIAAAMEALADLEALVEPLAAAAGLDMDDEGDMADDEPEMDMPDMDMPDMAADAEAEADAEMAADEPEAMDDDAVVMEVAKRVARRILKARKAQAMLDEALGNK